MKTIIVYLDDADYAQLLLQAAAQAPDAHLAHWVLVGCAPRITHRVSRFVSNRSRESWRTKWADRLFQECVPLLQARGAKVTPVLARGPLPALLESLQLEHGTQAQVVDMRRPKQAPDAAGASMGMMSLRKLGGTLAGIAAVCTVLIGETLAA